jgi:hypothetical protein
MNIISLRMILWPKLEVLCSFNGHKSFVFLVMKGDKQMVIATLLAFGSRKQCLLTYANCYCCLNVSKVLYMMDLYIFNLVQPPMIGNDGVESTQIGI